MTINLIAKVGGFREGMTQAERIADKKSRQIEKNMKERAKAIDAAFASMARSIAIGMGGLVAGAGVAVAGMASIARETVKGADEIARFAQLSSTTTEEFQRLAYGANTLGISTEKLADIFKDVQDKAGDFAQTGGGGMADFFENIAPKVGVTVDQFRRLSGPEALQLYVSSLEKANLSQQDMIFYMEAIASDSSMLLPLLQSGGREWRALGDEAQRYGAILSDEAIAATKAYKEEQQKLDAAMKGLRIEMTQELLPTMTEFSRAMSDPATMQAVRELTGLLGDFARMAASAARTINGSSFWGWLQVGKDDADDVNKAIEETEKKIKSLQDDVRSMSRPLFRYFEADNIAIANGQINTLQAKLQSLYSMRDAGISNAAKELEQLGRIGLEGYGNDLPKPALSPVATKPGGSKGKTQSDKDADAAQRYIETLKRQADQVQQMGHYEKLLYDLREGTLRITDAEVLKEAERLAIQADFAKDGQERERERTRLLEDGIRLTEQMRTPLEQLTVEQARINQLYEAGAISAETQARALQMARVAAFGMAGELEKWIRGDVQPLSGGRFDDQQARYEAEAKAEEERYTGQLERLTQAMEAERLTREEFYTQYEAMAQVHAERMAQIDQARYSVMLGQASSGFGQLVETMKGAQGEATGVYKALFAVSKAFSIAEAMLGLNTAIANAMKLPWPANLAAAASAAGYMATIISNVQSVTLGFADGGYTGPGGKYDVAGVVHAGEGVLSQRDMAALGGPAAFERFRKSLHGYSAGGVVGLPPAVARGHDAGQKGGDGSNVQVIIHNAPPGTQVRERKVDDKYITEVFLGDLNRGGPMSRGLESTFGTVRQGR